MGTNVGIFTGGTQVITSDRRKSKLAESLASSGMTGRRIQTNTNGTFKRLVNGEQVGNAIRGELNVIIVGALPQVSRILYKAEYDPEAEATLPNCWSNLGDKPEPGVAHPEHTNCAECPMNIPGSGKQGKRACRYQRRISVLVEGDSSGEVYQFNVPAKSLFGKGTGNVHPFESYIKFLLANGESPDNVVTHIEYDLNAETMELQFSPVRNTTDEEYELVVAAQERPETELYTKITVGHTDGVTKKALDKPTEKKPVVQRSDEPDDEPAPAKKAAKPPVDDTDEEEAPEPTKRPKKAAAEEATETDDLASVLDAWGSDD